MKKQLLLTLSLLFTAIFINGQCTPNPQYADSAYGVWPDTVQNFIPGTVGASYAQVLDFKLPLDAGVIDPTFAGVNIDSAVLISVSGLPAGLTYVCNTATNSWMGGDQGCATIQGTPTVQGSFDITIDLEGWVTVFFAPFSQPISFTGYVIDVGAAGIETIQVTNETFVLQQNFPNPTNGNTTIQFVAGNQNQIDFTITNLLGDVVYNQQINAKRGVNTLDINTNEFSSGVYLYAIANGNNKLTKRMIVSK
ncbi:MAG: T9SS type A sorting domain-containing protein [Parvicellaceae bacterium]